MCVQRSISALYWSENTWIKNGRLGYESYEEANVIHSTVLRTIEEFFLYKNSRNENRHSAHKTDRFSTSLYFISSNKWMSQMWSFFTNKFNLISDGIPVGRWILEPKFETKERKKNPENKNARNGNNTAGHHIIKSSYPKRIKYIWLTYKSPYIGRVHAYTLRIYAYAGRCKRNQDDLTAKGEQPHFFNATLVFLPNGNNRLKILDKILEQTPKLESRFVSRHKSHTCVPHADDWRPETHRSQ